MIGSVVRVPLRLTRCGAGIALDGASAIAGSALGLAGHLADAVTGGGGPDLDLDGSEHVHHGRERANASTDRVQEPREPQEAAAAPARERPGRAQETRPAPAAQETRPAPAAQETRPAPAAREARPAPAGDAQAPPAEVRPAPARPETEPEPPEPTHVSEEATLVDESADPGAEDGAGAQVTVAEPWKGYRELRADDVIDRITAASTAELAAVELYELSHRRRQAVLTAVQRELARADRDDPDRRAGDEGQ